MKNKLLIVLLIGFNLISHAQPVITSFSPTSGKPGSTVVLTGTGFNSTSSDNIVRLGGIKCTITSGSSTSLTVVLPSQITNEYFYVTDVPNTMIGKSFHKFLAKSDSTNDNISATTFSGKISIPVGASGGYLNRAFGMADLDDDGDFDFAAFENTSLHLKLITNDWTSGTMTGSSFSTSILKYVAHTSGDASKTTALVDIDSDGDLDFYSGKSGFASSGHTSRIYLNNTSSSTVTVDTVPTILTALSNNASNPQFADFNQDGLMDFVASYSWSEYPSENKGTSPPSFGQYTLTNTTYGASSNNTTLDINSDGVVDVAFTGDNATYGFKWAVNNTTANSASTAYSFSSIGYQPTQQNYSGIWEGDFNNDEKMDIMVFRNNSASVFQNNSTSTSSYGFASGISLSLGSLSVYAVQFADFNNDGLLDIIAGTNNTLGNAVYFYQNTTTSTGGTISFATGVKLIDNIGSVVQQIEVVDINQDGFWDIITKGTTSTNLEVHLNLKDLPPTYYVKSTGVSALGTLTNWTNLQDGTGGTPPSFAINAIFSLSNSSNSTSFALGTNLTLTGAKLVIPSGATLNITTSRILTLSGCTFSNSGTISGTVGSITITGTGNITLDGSITTGTFTTNTSSNVTIASNATLNVYNQLNLTSVGTFTTNNNVTLKSISTKTAIMGPASGSISGNINCELYIAGGYRKYRFLSHPFSTNQNLSQLTDDVDITGSGGSSNGFTSTGTNNPSAFWFNPANGDGATNDAGWTAFTSASGGTGNTWAPGQGIRTLIRGAKNEGLDGATYTPSAVTLDMSGPVNVGDVTVSLDYAGSNNSLGLNLIGNPYASPIDASGLVYNSSSASNINKTIYYRNSRQGSYTTDVLTSGTVYSVPAYAAFFIKTSASTASVTFTESLKQTTSALTTFMGLGDEQTPNLLRISALIRKEQYDKLDFHFGQEYGDTLDQVFDAFKMSNDYLNFYSLTSDNSKAAIDFRALDTTQLIPLGISIPKNTKDTVELVFDANNTNTQLFLYDYLNHVKTPIKAGNNYEIVIDAQKPETIGDNRFVIGSVTALEKLSNKIKHNLYFNVYPNPVGDVLNLHSMNYNQIGTVRIFDLKGMELMNTTIDFNESLTGTVNTKSLKSGLYLIEICSKSGQKFKSKFTKL